jgi:hypothetical protein
LNLTGERQHYVSRVLLERFKIPGQPLQCYQVETGAWMPKSVENACAESGYNQLLAFGENDNSLEEAFSKVESRLPKTFRALEAAAQRSRTDLPAPIFENLCRYCAFLKLSSLAAKASAVVNFVYLLNFEVETGHHHLLRELQISEAIISGWKTELLAGRRVIIDASNALQLLYRNQFYRVFSGDYGMFCHAKWVICESPLDLPMSDIGLVPLLCAEDRLNRYILPIAPRLVLQGIFFHDVKKNAARQPLKGLSLTHNEAEYCFDVLCASAVNEIVCSRQMPNIAEGFDRAKAKGIRFLEIVNPGEVTSAGLRDSPTEIHFRIVSMTEFVAFVHSFVKPPENYSTGGGSVKMA